MQPSPLRLLHYHLLAIDIKPTEDYEGEPNTYPDINDCILESTVGVGIPADIDDPDDYFVKLDLKASPKEGKSFPYTLHIDIQGYFNIDPEFKIADKSEFASINGASMLYGVLREVLLATTLRFEYGAIMLPTVNFLDMKKQKPTKQEE